MTEMIKMADEIKKPHYEKVLRSLESNGLSMSRFKMSDKILQSELKESEPLVITEDFNDDDLRSILLAKQATDFLNSYSDMMRKISVAQSVITDSFNAIRLEQYKTLVRTRMNNYIAKEKAKLKIPGTQKSYDLKATDFADIEEIPFILTSEDVLLTSMLTYYKGKIYKIAKNFGEHLYLTNLDIQAKYLPKKMVCCIEFPESLRFKALDLDDTYFHCAYIFLDSFSIEKGVLPCIRYYLPHFNSQGKLTEYRKNHGVDIGHIRWHDDNEKLSDIVKRHQKSSTVYVIKGLVEYIVKCILYIHSGDPDLREYKAPLPPNKDKKARRFFKEHENQSLVDMFLIGYNHKKEILYSKEETIVREFFRWQHYGPQNSLLKYIWIDEHPRVFKNVIKLENGIKNDVLDSINEGELLC
jgi:hypothetical protein